MFMTWSPGSLVWSVVACRRVWLPAWLVACVAVGLYAPRAALATEVRLAPQNGHSENVVSAVFSPDGARVVTASWDGAVLLWDVRTGVLLRRLDGQMLHMVSLDPDGARVVTAGFDGTAELWDVRTGDRLHAFEGHTGAVRAAAFSPRGDRIVTAGEDGTAAIWDARSGARLHNLKGHGDDGLGAAFSPDGARVLTASDDGTAALWDAATGERLHRLKGHRASVRSAAFSPDGARVVTTSDDATSALWDAATGERLRLLEGHEKSVVAAAFSADGTRVATASVDQTAAVWDARSGERLAQLTGHAEMVTAVSFSPDGSRVLTASLDGSARLWDARSGAPLPQRLEAPRDGPAASTLSRGGLNAAAFSPDGARVVTASEDGTAALWDAETGALIHRLGRYTRSLWGVAFSPDGARLVTASADGAASVWDARTGARALQLAGHTEAVTSAAFSTDGARVLTASDDGTVALWDAVTGARVLRLTGLQFKAFASASLSPDGARVLTGSNDGTATLWDARTGERMRVLNVRDGRAPAWVDGRVQAMFSSDGGQVVTLRVSDGAVVVWDADTGARFTRLRRATRRPEGPFDRDVWRVALSPDGARILTGGTNGAVALWDARSGRRLRRVRAHDSVINAVVFTPDGGRALTASADGTAALWDGRTGALLHQVRLAPNGISAAAFSPDGARAAAGHGDGNVTVLDAETGEVLHRMDRSPGGFVWSLAWSPDGARLVAADDGGFLTFWDAATGARLGSLLSRTDGSWAAFDDAGRFDTPDIGALDGAAWLREQDPLWPLPLTSFAREFYTPGLFRRTLAGEALPPVPDLAAIDVRAPEVRLSAEHVGDTLTAVVEVCPPAPRPADPPTPWAGAHDLRVLLDGRLVAWVDGPLGAACATHRLPVALGARSRDLTAYAFNAAQVKSRDATFSVPDRPLGPVPRRAFVVSVGVNDYADRGFGDLRWAGADALAMRDALAGLPDHAVRSVLLADGGNAAPTRENLRAALAALAGGPIPAWAPGFSAAGPDDLVVVTFAGHGWAPPRALPDGRSVPGAFHLMLSDAGRADTDGRTGALPYAVSEDELAAWLRPVLAGDLALIVDACQSASSVEGEEFRPGPLGSRGFGQLAYDKGMLVLAASQSDAVALESAALQHGLLTWALVEDGLRQRRADIDADGVVALDEWLRYAEGRVPELAGAVARGEPIGAARGVFVDGRGLTLVVDPAIGPSVAQQPRLFAFKAAGSVVVGAQKPADAPASP